VNTEFTRFRIFVDDLIGDPDLAQTLVDIIGYAGMVLILLAFYLISAGKVEGNSRAYQVINLFGGVGILINAYYFNAMPSVVLNAIWIVIAGVALAKTFSGRSRATPATRAQPPA
jgi:hypothetical protein